MNDAMQAQIFTQHAYLEQLLAESADVAGSEAPLYQMCKLSHGRFATSGDLNLTRLIIFGS